MISKKNLVRFIIVCVLIVFNIYMGKIFLSQTNLVFSAQAARLLALVGIKIPSKLTEPYMRLNPTPEPFTLAGDQIVDLVNEERKKNSLASLTKNQKLNEIAQKLAQTFAQQNYEIENHDYGENINQILKETGYQYEVVADVAVIGPLSSQAALDHWLGQETQRKHLLDKAFTETGIFTQEITIDGQKNGLAIQILAKPCEASPLPSPVPIQVKSNASPKPVIPKASPVPIISDDDVVRALNEYRTDHKVHQLIIDQNLCKYAEKRVADLQKKGSLDGHEGFQKDFADPNNLPESIKAYSGGTIGENLASQFCINGTTGQSFTATSAPALIEWCFDSSTKGHREAQLNERYNAVCSRHGSNMYVVIFGE